MTEPQDVQGAPASRASSLGRAALWVGRVEALSYVLLLGVAMPLKYLAQQPGPLRVIGMAHGLLFVLYVGAVFAAARQQRWGADLNRWAAALVASFIPLAPLFVEWVYEPADAVADGERALGGADLA